MVKQSASPKKCQPLKCKTFAQKAYKFEEKMPVDVFVVKCPYRTHDNCCENAKESLREVFY